MLVFFFLIFPEKFWMRFDFIIMLIVVGIVYEQRPQCNGQIATQVALLVSRVLDCDSSATQCASVNSVSDY